MGTETLICSICGGAPGDCRDHEFKEMSDAEATELAGAVLDILGEMDSLGRLTNAELSDRLLALEWPPGTDELLCEICSRLDPGWENK